MKNSESATSLTKYRQAAYSFFLSNVLYVIIVFIFLPPFNFDLSTIISLGLYFLVIVLLSYFVYIGKRKPTIILAFIFSIRSVFSTYTLVTGQAFIAVPYVLPILILTFYFLGRAVWNWA